MKFKKIIYLVLGGTLLLSLSVSGVMAAEFRTAKKGGNITVDKDEKVKNLYTAGNMVSINGDIEKDLYAVGNIITLNGNVEHNIYAGGSTIVIRGNVGGSIHAAAGNILIEGEVKEDLFVGGGNITLSESASVMGDLFVGGGTISIEGPVAGDASLAGGQITINSRIDGQVKAEVDELILGSQAQIGKDLSYKSSKEASIDEKAEVLGEINFKEREAKEIGPLKAKKGLAKILTLVFWIKILIGIVVGLVLVYLLRRLTERVVKEGLTRFWTSLSFGFSALILTPVAGIIIAITLIGIGLTGLIFLTYFLIVILSVALANISFGSWLIKVFRKQSEYRVDWLTVVLGVIVLNIVVLVPFVGWLVGFIFMLISLGSLYRLIYQNLISKKS